MMARPTAEDKIKRAKELQEEAAELLPDANEELKERELITTPHPYPSYPQPWYPPRTISCTTTFTLPDDWTLTQ